MNKFKFATGNVYRDIFAPGKLTALAEEIYSGLPRKDYKGLTVDELAQIPTLYASINPLEQSVLDIEDEKVFKTSNNKEVLGADIKAITMLMYDKPRTAYVDFGRVK